MFGFRQNLNNVFYILIMGDAMTLYLDVFLFVNFFIDSLLLLTVAFLLKRKVTIERLFFGAFLGGFTVFFFFFDISNFLLFFVKIFCALGMVLLTFSYHNFRYTLKNFLYFYLSSFVLGGIFYSLLYQFSIQQQKDPFFLQMTLLVIGTPIFLFLYQKQVKQMKEYYNHCYFIEMKIGQNKIMGTGFFDSGNVLVDPYKKKPVILMDRKKCTINMDNFPKVFVPYKTIKGEGILSCIKIDSIKIEGVGEKKELYLGLLDRSISFDGVDVLLNNKLWEE